MLMQDLFSLGWMTYLFHYIYIYIYIYIYAYLTQSVCGDDRITCYPGADELTGEPGDA